MRLLLLAACLPVLWAQGIWDRRAPYPVEVTEVSSAVLNGKIYSICGLLRDGSRDSVLRVYDPVRDEWTAAARVPIPDGADHCNFAAARGRLYVLGAIRTGTNFTDGATYEYNPETDQWTVVGRMGVPRGASGVTVIGDRIYVVGGLDPIRPLAAAEVFDTASRTWSQLPDMPTARDHLTAQAVSGKVYAIAGRNGATNLRANEEYDPATNNWRVRAGIVTARGGVGSGTLRNRIQVFGGEGQSGRPEQTFEQHEEYDPDTDTWGTLAIMRVPRHGLYGATYQGRIFTPGGGPRAGADFSNAHDAFLLPLTEAPAVTQGSVVNAASFRPEVSGGAILVLYGSNLSQGELQAVRFPIGTRLNTTEVRVNGTLVPLLYVGPSQINFQLPFSLVPGPLSITVSHAGQTSAVASGPDAVPASPAVFQLDGNGKGAITIAATGEVRAARRGESIVIYGTGMGRVDFVPRLGEAAPLNPLIRTVETPVVRIGGVEAAVGFSGLTPGSMGLYQLNVQVPANAPVGAAVPVVVRAGGRDSNSVTMAVVE